MFSTAMARFVNVPRSVAVSIEEGAFPVVAERRARKSVILVEIRQRRE